MSYSKLYSSIVQSSLWNEDDHVRLLFITLLALSDREGFVMGSRMGLMRIANIDPEQIKREDPFDILMSADSDSSDLMRNPENEGRRIEEVPGGFRILNFIYYRSLRNEDDRREQNKEAQQRFRNKLRSAKVSQRKPRSAALSPDNPISDADADADTPPIIPQGGNSHKPESESFSRNKEHVRILFNRRASTEWTPKELKALKAMGEVCEDDWELLEKYYVAERAKGEKGIHRRDVATFLNNFSGELDRARSAKSTNVNTNPLNRL